MLFVSHDLREAILLADRILFLSPAPAGVLADVRVDLPREERQDPVRIEAFRGRLIRDNPEAYRDLQAGSVE